MGTRPSNQYKKPTTTVKDAVKSTAKVKGSTAKKDKPAGVTEQPQSGADGRGSRSKKGERGRVDTRSGNADADNPQPDQGLEIPRRKRTRKGNDASEEEQPYSKDRDSQEHSEKHKGGSGVKGARRRIVNASRAHKGSEADMQHLEDSSCDSESHGSEAKVSGSNYSDTGAHNDEETDSDEEDSLDVDSDEEDRPLRKSRKHDKQQLKVSLKRRKFNKSAHNNPDQLLDILKQLLAGKGDDKQKSKKVKGHGRDEDEPLGSHLKKRISRCCKDQQSQRSYFPDAAAIERAAKKIAKEETDGERPSPSLLDAIVKQIRTSMSKLVRGPLASKIKQAVAVSYKDVDEQDYEGMISDFSYRKTEEEEYGAEAFMGLLIDVFATDLDKDTLLQISASQLAFAELGVFQYLKKEKEFPKENAAGKAGRAAYQRFLEQASQGVDETALFVKGTNKEAAKNK